MLSTMRHGDRCCNPFGLPKHFKKVGLRVATQAVTKKFPDFRMKYFCRTCYSKMKDYTTTSVVDSENASIESDANRNWEDPWQSSVLRENSSVPILDRNEVESVVTHHQPLVHPQHDNYNLPGTSAQSHHSFIPTPTQDTVESVLTEISRNQEHDCLKSCVRSAQTQNRTVSTLTQRTIVSMPSELSVTSAETACSCSSELALPVVNHALKMLDVSPIPRKKLKRSFWVKKKLEGTTNAIRSSLGLPVVEEQIDEDSIGFNEIISQLKDKYKSISTSKAERMQILTLIPSTWSNSKVSEEFGASLYTVKQARKLCQEKGVLAKPDSKFGRSLDEQTKAEVISLYEDEQVSVTMPGMKHFVTIGGVNGEKTRRQKKLMLGNLKELYQHFKEENPNIKVGFSMFASLRTKHCVLAGGAGTHTVCVCPVHQNMKLMISACNLKALTKNSATPLAKYEDCTPLMLCPTPKPSCHLLQCQNCPNLDQLRDMLVSIFADNDIEDITYSQWVLKPRATLETFVKSVDEFIDDFCEQARSLLPHCFIAKQQSNFLKSSKENLKEGECIVICDFAENYAFTVQNAAPGFHWNNDQATVYPVVVYYKRNGETMHKSLVIISDCLNHDSVAVHVYTRIVVDFITSEIGRPSRISYFSDGAPQQFKNFKNFANLWYHEADFGIPAERHFFATAHGKGPCDGIGGTLKRLAARASLQLAADRQILTPHDLYEWASMPGTLPSITKKFSGADSYNSAKELLKARFDEVKAIPQTQKQHCFIPTPEGMVTKLHSTSPDFRVHNIMKKKNVSV